MKKYVFIFLAGAVLVGASLQNWGVTLAAMAVLFTWLVRENSLRTSFRFLRGQGIKESNFSLGADVTLVEISADGSCAVFVTVDGAVAMRNSRGIELWKRPAEPGILALLPCKDGACYYAIADEIVHCGQDGAVIARLAFEPPEYRQSYRLHLSVDSSVLLLHTPWFLQFINPDLGTLGQRIDCETTGHYMKYAALSPFGNRVFFAGAKLLEDEQGTEARWGSWKQSQGQWVSDWAQTVDGGGNSHLRGVAFSQDGNALLLELYQEGYEFRLLNTDGSLRWKRDGVEHPRLSSDAALVLWESKLDGLVLAASQDKTKIWTRKAEDKIRHKAVNAAAECLVIEGRHVIKFDRSGAITWDAWFQNDPYRFAASSDGRTLAVVQMNKGGILRFPLA